jgi:hypothetical protein
VGDLCLRSFLGGTWLFAHVVVCTAKTDKSVASLISMDSVFTVWLIHLIIHIPPSPVQNVSCKCKTAGGLTRHHQAVHQMDKLSSALRAHTELGMMDGTMLSYTKMILKGEQPQVWAVAGDADNGEDDDNGPEPGLKAL